MDTFETAAKIRELLLARGWKLATCESLTSGMIASEIAEVPGVSAVYEGGFVTYSCAQKHAMADVPEEILGKYGAVSRQTAEAMCLGTARRTGADIAVSATGNAGPDASEGKPVGMVFIGVALHGTATVKEYRFQGTRPAIREASAAAALSDLLETLEGGNGCTVKGSEGSSF
ncbi:MAG: CinA family protein [Lachnospiraceae bacterium]|jgi:PncC family amidohydrolase|nr:CinA family protein [Lachnospiraceae bacterium]